MGDRSAVGTMLPPDSVAAAFEAAFGRAPRQAQLHCLVESDRPSGVPTSATSLSCTANCSTLERVVCALGVSGRQVEVDEVARKIEATQPLGETTSAANKARAQGNRTRSLTWTQEGDV